MMQHGSTDTDRHCNLDDDRLLDLVQRQTFGFFWEGAHPVSGLARDRQKTTSDPNNDLVAVGGTGFGIMAMIVAVTVAGCRARALWPASPGCCRSSKYARATTACLHIS